MIKVHIQISLLSVPLLCFSHLLTKNHFIIPSPDSGQPMLSHWYTCWRSCRIYPFVCHLHPWDARISSDILVHVPPHRRQRPRLKCEEYDWKKLALQQPQFRLEKNIRKNKEVSYSVAWMNFLCAKVTINAKEGVIGGDRGHTFHPYNHYITCKFLPGFASCGQEKRREEENDEDLHV